MKEVSGSGGTHPMKPETEELYRKEYRQAADLFQRALENDEKSNDIYQKAEFKKVMDRALLVLNETARALKAENNRTTQNQQIQKDYQAWQQHPDEVHQKKLYNDLEDAKNL